MGIGGCGEVRTGDMNGNGDKEQETREENKDTGVQDWRHGMRKNRDMGLETRDKDGEWTESIMRLQGI